jgi:hypothetical protein
MATAPIATRIVLIDNSPSPTIPAAATREKRVCRRKRCRACYMRPQVSTRMHEFGKNSLKEDAFLSPGHNTRIRQPIDNASRNKLGAAQHERCLRLFSVEFSATSKRYANAGVGGHGLKPGPPRSQRAACSGGRATRGARASRTVDLSFCWLGPFCDPRHILCCDDVLAVVDESGQRLVRIALPVVESSCGGKICRYKKIEA